MSEHLDGIDAGDLLQHMPSSVRISLETLERAGTDWNAVGHLLAATPNAGVALSGTGQWTADLWEAVKWVFRSFLCTDSEPYSDLRTGWDDLKEQSSATAVASLATLIATRLGAASGVIAPLVIWLVVAARRTGQETVCLTLSAAPGVSSVQPRSPFA